MLIEIQFHGNQHIITRVTYLEAKQEVSPRGDVISYCKQLQ
jgi:hypothetical protein